jgi:hypothetical protein
MAGKKLSRNAPCPCGSGRKYKHCCLTKGFDWIEDDNGTVRKSVPLSAEAVAILHEQRRRFVERFGREPGPNDLVFFDLPPVEQVEFQTAQAMRKAGIDEAIIYAYEKTGGLLVTEENMHLIPEKDLEAWRAAIEEYLARPRGRQEAGG